MRFVVLSLILWALKPSADRYFSPVRTITELLEILGLCTISTPKMYNLNLNLKYRDSPQPNIVQNGVLFNLILGRVVNMLGIRVSSI